jgi:hypothetical protein
MVDLLISIEVYMIPYLLERASLTLQCIYLHGRKPRSSSEYSNVSSKYMCVCILV